MLNLIEIASKLRKARDTAKRFFGNDFAQKIEPHQHIIREVMKSNNITNELEALLLISQTNVFKDNAFTQILFYAAAVEMMEEG